jgi:thiol-disulfide isomerase/thioredoxin
MRYGLVAVIIVAILGTAYIVSERAGLDLVGTGGVNAQLIPKVGEEAPELLVRSADGTQVIPLSTLRGRPVWINFWGSWCPPCRAEMPEVIQAYDTAMKSGVVMLGVNEGEPAQDAFTYADRVGINFPIVFPIELSDEQIAELKAETAMSPETEAALDSSTKKWQVNNWPTHLFIDAEGFVRAVVIAPLTYESALEYVSLIVPGGVAPEIAPPAASPEATPAA